MKVRNIQLIALILVTMFRTHSWSQVDFDTTAYYEFLQNTENLEYYELTDLHPLKHEYYKGIERDITIWDHLYLDSINDKYNLTVDEFSKIEENYFVITERLSYDHFANALHDIYIKDLPVFLSTDAILHALHASYDVILQEIEINIMQANLEIFLSALYSYFPNLMQYYQNDTLIIKSLEDVDLYVTIAYSLIKDSLQSSHLIDNEKVEEVWNYILSEQMASIPLFTEDTRLRMIDFSQFKVRGHYTDTWEVEEGLRISLEPYFKTMMWLGRIDFLLTEPPGLVPWTIDELKRMNISALMLNELVDLSLNRELLQQNNEIINYMVGESDNLTSSEYSEIIASQNIVNAAQLLDDDNFNALQEALIEAFPNGGQRILSSIFIVDPCNPGPAVLPISYKLSGQRFILDSYILSNVVFDRVIYQGSNVMRMMPDPLDAMFVLGNENALPLLQEEIEEYPYSSQLAALRYLVDCYDDEYWETSLYNTWLGSLRKLVAPEDNSNHPLFMRTAAWQQEKLNTQLASWAQLRHDNLLYAKPSYTMGAICFYPHSYIEPYPEFYEHLGVFAANASDFFSGFSTNTGHIVYYFNQFEELMNKLKNIAEKELNGELFNEEEIEFLGNMLVEGDDMCSPPYGGWYPGLYYDWEDVTNVDYLTADIHTQPTDEFGNIVGKVLHVGVGKVNLGVFLANSPSSNNQPMAFVGPVMSYYEKTTENFYHMTDEEWNYLVEHDDLPVRPDWVNIYLTDSTGTVLPEGRELPSVIYVGNNEPNAYTNHKKYLKVFPNPSITETVLQFYLNEPGFVQINIFNSEGKLVKQLNNDCSTGVNNIKLSLQDFSKGIYFCQVNSPNFSNSVKIILMDK